MSLVAMIDRHDEESCTTCNGYGGVIDDSVPLQAGEPFTQVCPGCLGEKETTPPDQTDEEITQELRSMGALLGKVTEPQKQFLDLVLEMNQGAKRYKKLSRREKKSARK